MNRLKKKAMADFWRVCVITAAGLLIFGMLTYTQVRGAKYLIIGLIYAGLLVALMIYRNKRKGKQQTAAAFDEREFQLIVRSASYGSSLFIGYIVLAMLAAFYLIGGRGTVPMWSIPVVIYVGVFITGTIQSMILLHYAKEDERSIEGGAA